MTSPKPSGPLPLATPCRPVAVGALVVIVIGILAAAVAVTGTGTVDGTESATAVNRLALFALNVVAAATVCALGAAMLGYATHQQFFARPSHSLFRDEEFRLGDIGRWAGE